MGLSSFVVGSERRMCFETECIMALQGHPRSLDICRVGPICDFLIPIGHQY